VTWSKEQRNENMVLALRLMLDRIGDRAVDLVFLDSDEPEFKEVFPTTWVDLERRGFVKRSPPYRLTGAGWLEALHVAERLDDEFDRDLGILCASLKSKVDGRREKAVVDVSQIVRETGLSEDWVFNVIESDAISRRYGRTGAYWHPSDRMKHVIEVPLDFGMERL
jgi:hypothetical protein